MSYLDPKIFACTAKLAIVCLCGCCAATHNPSPATTQASSEPRMIRIDESSIYRQQPQRNVVYLCQASGSMLSRFGELKSKLKESIQYLDAGDGPWFNVIFMVDGHAVTLFDDGCRAATRDNKKLASDFIDGVICTGNCNPSTGADVASRQHADMIFLISNGEFSGEPDNKVLEDFKPVFAHGKTLVNCFLMPSDDNDIHAKGILNKIANAGHGSFHEVPTTTKPSGGN